MTAPRPHVGKVRREVPDPLEDVIIRAMAIDPADRFPDMAALAAALRQSRESARPRRKTVMAVIAAAAIAAGAAGAVAWLATRPAAVAVTEQAERIAVLPFSASGPGVEVLGEGMVDLLTTNLQGVGGIQVVDPRLVLKRWGRKDPDEESGVEEALDLGRELDAGSVVTGSAVSAGGRVRLAADLYAVAGGERLGRAQVDGPADSILPLVDRLSVALLRDVWRSREPLPSLDLGSLTTDSIGALRAYLQGERYYRRFALDSALAQYTRAVEVDSTFALAHLRRALVIGWTGGYGSPASVQAADAGFRFAERLPPRSRRLLAGYQAFQEGSSPGHRLDAGVRERLSRRPRGLVLLRRSPPPSRRDPAPEPRHGPRGLRPCDRGRLHQHARGGASARDNADLQGQHPVQALSPSVRPDRPSRPGGSPPRCGGAGLGAPAFRERSPRRGPGRTAHRLLLGRGGVPERSRDLGQHPRPQAPSVRGAPLQLPGAPLRAVRPRAHAHWPRTSPRSAGPRGHGGRDLTRGGGRSARLARGARPGSLVRRPDQDGLPPGAGQVGERKPADGGLCRRHPGRGAGSDRGGRVPGDRGDPGSQFPPKTPRDLADSCARRSAGPDWSRATPQPGSPTCEPVCR